MELHDLIHIENARTNNLKGISVDIPCNSFTVITGVSGSGKSSLAFDTLYVEGRRRYVESLKSYARSFLGQMPKPDVDRIDNLPPSIAIQQKRFSSNPRSTVGTITEIYDYLKLLYAKIGKTISPDTKQEIKSHTVHDVLHHILQLPDRTKIYILARTFLKTPEEVKQKQKQWKKGGYSRVLYKKEEHLIDDDILVGDITDLADIYLLVDRLKIDRGSLSSKRIIDSSDTAFKEGNGYCSLFVNYENGENEFVHFSSFFEENDVKYTRPSVHFFDFNNPLGQCPRCKGLGYVTGIDENYVIPDKSLSIYEGAIVCWHGQQMQKYQQEFIKNAHKFNFPIHTPYNKLRAEEKLLLWRGNEYFMGLDAFFQMLNTNKRFKIQERYLLSRFQGKSVCPDCGGSRLKKETGYVKINGLDIATACNLSISDIIKWLQSISVATIEQNGIRILYDELFNRLVYLQKVGLSYLTLGRMASTLSGGESQRLMLSKLLGSGLVGTLYVLDEPSIGLHPRDTERLIKVLIDLRNMKNTLIVVEHDEEIIAAADFIILMGPKAGQDGGEIVYQGKPNKINFPFPIIKQRRPVIHTITLKGIIENNLKDITVTFPLQTLTVVSGVSGSGKSTLIEDVLYPMVDNYCNSFKEGGISCLKKQLCGDLDKIDEVILVNQSILGISSRSNPATYTKVFDDIRNLFASQGIARQMGFTASHFSFNTPGGRCEYCKGEGKIKFEMQFMSDIILTCDHCNGKRFKKDILGITYRDKSINDVLQMTIDEAIEFFSTDKKNKAIIDKLQPLHDVGIGYIKMGQSLGDLSGGESQRLKIASFLKEKPNRHILFLFDEPTTGLSSSDIEVLLQVFDRLIQLGHSLIVIEHNPFILWAADYVIDMGPEGGDEGGEVVFCGTPDKLIQCENNYTGLYLKHYLNKKEKKC